MALHYAHPHQPLNGDGTVTGQKEPWCLNHQIEESHLPTCWMSEKYTECGKSLICGTYLLQHLLPNLPYPSSKAQKKGRSAQSQQRNHSYTEDGSMRLSFIISPPNDRRRFGAHTTLSFDCPCRLSIGTACGCILIAIFPCLVNMSLSFTGLKESPGEDVQSKKKRLGQNCGKTVKREMKKKS